MSKQIPLKYHGPKPMFEDTLYDTGIWGAGAVKKVDCTTASYMLMHPDLWADARPAAARKKDPITPQKKPQEYRHHKLDQQPAMANLLAMTKESLVQYAHREFATVIPAENLTAQQVRDKVHTLIRSRS